MNSQPGQTAPNARPTASGFIAWMIVVAGLPLLSVFALALLWRPPTSLEALLSVLFYCLGGFGISLGWHRFFTHKGFKCKKLVSLILAASGSLAGEGSLASWVANHRLHHLHTDQPGDPHSPHLHGSLWRGFLHAHLGWLRLPGACERRHARDILSDGSLALISRFWWTITLAGLFLPALIVAFFGGLAAGFGVWCWAGLVRLVLFHHVTWSVNSVCHLFGRRPFATSDESGNVAWLALASFGESWHNNHHASPARARHGVSPGQVDLSARLLALLERLGLVWDVRWSARP